MRACLCPLCIDQFYRRCQSLAMHMPAVARTPPRRHFVRALCAHTCADPAMAMPAARATTDDERSRKRLRAIKIVQSQAAFRLYAAQRGATNSIVLQPPDALDAGITCRRWKWLMRTYDKGLKAYHASHAPSADGADGSRHMACPSPSVIERARAIVAVHV